MAASGSTPIVLFNSGTTGNQPTTSNLQVGELAINYTDGKLFYNNGTSIAVLANASVAGTIPIPISSGGTNTTATPTAGTIAYGTGTAIAYTSVGTTGQVLTSSGSGAPTWASPYGAMTKIGTYTLSGSSTTYLLSLTGGFNRYLLILDNWITPTLQQFEMQLGYGGTPTIITSGYQAAGSHVESNQGSNISTQNTNNLSYFYIGNVGNYSSYGGLSAMIYVNNVNGPYATIFGNSIYTLGSNYVISATFNGRVLNTNAITAVNFLNGGSGTDYFSGSITVYGIN